MALIPGRTTRRTHVFGIGSRLVAASAALFLVAASATAYNATERFVTFSGLLLYNDTFGDWNRRTRDAYSANGTYTTVRGACANRTGVAYAGEADGPDHLVLDGVSPPGYVFAGGCGVIYLAEGTVFEGGRNRTWSDGSLSLDIGAGCTTRVVNGTWDNYCPGEPGGGYHREYLAPVEEETVVYANGVVCYNETASRGGGYPESSHSAMMLQANCSAGGSRAVVRLRHTCRGYVLLDSAYSVMGWVRRCDRERYMKYCLEGCAAANKPGSRSEGGAGGSGGGCDSACCMATCTDQADHKCTEEKSEKADCPNTPTDTYGRPGDGSSEYFIEKPADSLGDPCYCRYLWDGDTACFNNRVSVAVGEEYECSDERAYYLGSEPALACNGSYSDYGGYLKGRLTLNVDPDVSSAFVFGGVPYRFTSLAPKHTLYGMPGAGGQPVREYSLLDGDYRFNESHNDSGYFDFAYPEAVPNGSPPTVGEGLVLDQVWGGNGTYEFEFTFEGADMLGNLTLTVLGIQDIIRGMTTCDEAHPCVEDGYCIGGRCVGIDGLINRTLMVGDCLVRVPPPNLTMEAPETVGRYANVTVRLSLEANGTPLEGGTIALSCGGFRCNATTGPEGKAEASFAVRGENVLCRAEYYGAAAARLIRVEAEDAAIEPLFMFAALTGLIAVVFAVTEDRMRLSDFYETWRDFWR
jgi:hypothetical protein